MNLLLMGLRGSGKTTLGRAIAEIAGRPFIDLDDLTPGELGEATVAAAWAGHGQDAFRRAEAAVLGRVLTLNDHVVALGGGTPTAPGCADLLRDQVGSHRVLLVYLHASPAALRARLEGADNAHRPSLTGADPLTEIGAMYAARDPLYRDLAGAVVETDGQTTGSLAPLLAGMLARD